jgi:hypothetical protein
MLWQILGAYQVEVMNGQIFEEILHRLPGVKVLKVLVTFTLSYKGGVSESFLFTACSLWPANGRVSDRSRWR